MKALRSIGDRIVDVFVPKVDASALYYWRYTCTHQWGCWNGHDYSDPTLIAEYVHESTGTVTETNFVGCC